MYESLLQRFHLHSEGRCCLCSRTVLPGLPGMTCSDTPATILSTFLTAVFIQSSTYIRLSSPLCLFPNDCCLPCTFECSSSQQALHAANPVTLVICRSSAPAAALTAPPTSTCMTATPATTWTATVTTACARLTSSNASHCGDKVRERLPFAGFAANGSGTIGNFFDALCFCRSEAGSGRLLSKGQLGRRPLWQLWQGLQRLLCQM